MKRRYLHVVYVGYLDISGVAIDYGYCPVEGPSDSSLRIKTGTEWVPLEWVTQSELWLAFHIAGMEAIPDGDR